jgi:hypothetical protein
MQWAVRRRYSEFDNMHRQLRGCECVEPAVSKHFPSKTMFFTTLRYCSSRIAYTAVAG